MKTKPSRRYSKRIKSVRTSSQKKSQARRSLPNKKTDQNKNNTAFDSSPAPTLIVPTQMQSKGIIRYSFSGHETFPFRYTWLPKAIDQISRDPNLFNKEDAMVTLGVGKNMVKSIRHWCDTLGLVEFVDRGRSAKVTELGHALFDAQGWDPYLEDTATLWLLHWLLVSKQFRASTWYLAFTQYRADSFSRDDIVNWLKGIVAQTSNTQVTLASLRRDVEVFLRTYVAAILRGEGLYDIR